MIEAIKSAFGFSKKADNAKAVAVREISVGIAYDMRFYRNWMEQFFNPNPVMRQGQFTGYHLFEEMDADAHIRNTISLSKDLLLSKPFYVRSAKPGDPVEDEKAALVAWNFDRIKQIAQKKREILSALDYGYSVTEMVWGVEDVVISDRKIKKNGVESNLKGVTLPGASVITDLKTRIPSAFSFDGLGNMYMVPGTKDGYPSFMVPQLLSQEDAAHFMVLTHDPRFGSRYGWPVKASMFWPWLMKKAVKIYRMIFVEKYGMPYLKGTYAATVTDPKEIDAFEAKLKGLQKNSWIMAPEGFSIDFVEALNKTGTLDVYQAVLDHCDGDISEAALGHRKATDDTRNAADNLRQDKLEMLGAELDSVFNDQFIIALIDSNYPPNGLYPYVVTQTRPEADIDKEVFRAVSLHNIGMPLSKAWLYEMTGSMKPMDPEDTLEGATGGSAAPDTVGGENLPNTNISDSTLQTLGQQPDPLKQSGGKGMPGNPGRNIG